MGKSLRKILISGTVIFGMTLVTFGAVNSAYSLSLPVDAPSLPEFVDETVIPPVPDFVPTPPVQIPSEGNADRTSGNDIPKETAGDSPNASAQGEDNVPGDSSAGNAVDTSDSATVASPVVPSQPADSERVPNNGNNENTFSAPAPVKSGTPNQARGIVSFTFDDGWGSQFKNAFPMLKAANMPATFYIISARIPESADFSPLMNRSQLLELQSAGSEIASHTRTHPHLTTLPADRAAEEIAGSRTELAAMGFSPVDTFSYPFGEFNEQIKNMVKSSGYGAAVSVQPGFNTRVTDPFVLHRQEVIDTTTLAEMESWVRNAMQNNEWLILEFHHVGGESTPVDTDIYNVTPENFRQLVSFVRDSGIKVMTVSDAVREVQEMNISASTAPEAIREGAQNYSPPTAKAPVKEEDSAFPAPTDNPEDAMQMFNNMFSRMRMLFASDWL